MSDSSANDLKRVAGQLAEYGRRLQSLSKSIASAADDPFLQHDALSKAKSAIRDVDRLDGEPSTQLLHSINGDCAQRAAEFWHDFTREAEARRWQVHGTTRRRLVARGLFIELVDRSIKVEDVSGSFTPYVPHLVQLLAPVVDTLLVCADKADQFANLLATAYDQFGSAGEVSLEQIYRNAVMSAQPPTFWKRADPKSFRALNRPTFRASLSYLLSGGPRLADGREIRLGTTVDKRDAWEVYSETEGRVVQVGRLALVPKERGNE